MLRAFKIAVLPDLVACLFYGRCGVLRRLIYLIIYLFIYFRLVFCDVARSALCSVPLFELDPPDPRLRANVAPRSA